MPDAVAALLTRAHESGIKLWVEGDEVKFRCRGKSVPQTFLEELRTHRTTLLQHLAGTSTEPSEDRLSPEFVRRHHDLASVPSFRLATWRALKDKLTGVDSANLRFVMRVRGFLDLPAMSFAFEQLRARHEVLQATAMEMEGRPWLVYGAQPMKSMEVFDVACFAPQEREDAARARASELVWAPIDLATGPLFKGFVISLDTEDHILGLVMHHFIADMVSIGMLGTELIRNYSFKVAGHRLPAAPASLQYADYLLSCAEWIARPQIREHLQQWAGRLADAPHMDLLHRPPQAPTPDFACVRNTFEVGIERTAAIERCAQELRVSKFVVLMTVQKLLLACVTDQDTVTMGTVNSGREAPALVSVIGYFADRMHWSTSLEGDPTFAESVERVNNSYVEAMRYQFFRSDMVQEELTRRGKWLHAPVFNFIPYSRPQSNTAGSRFANFPIDPAPFSTIPLPGISYWLALVDTGQNLRGDIRFPHGSADALVRQLLTTLGMVMEDRTVRLSALRRELSDHRTGGAERPINVDI